MSNVEFIIQNLLPEYECILPFEQKKVSFNPFRVRDAKNLAILLEEKNKNLILKSLVKLLKTNSKGIDIDDLCLADAEYLFLQMRAKSIEEELNLLINGNPVKVNISEIEHKNNFLSTEIEISVGCFIKLRTPKIKDLLLIDLEDENAITNKSIKSISLNYEIYDIDKFLSDEAKQILDNLPLNILSKIKKELSNQPELFIKVPSNDGVCEVAGPLTFFYLAVSFFDLKDYYKINFNLINNYGWSLSDLDNMLFWEREIYANLLAEHNQKLLDENNRMGMDFYGR